MESVIKTYFTGGLSWKIGLILCFLVVIYNVILELQEKSNKGFVDMREKEGGHKIGAIILDIIRCFILYGIYLVSERISYADCYLLTKGNPLAYNKIMTFNANKIPDISYFWVFRCVCLVPFLLLFIWYYRKKNLRIPSNNKLLLSSLSFGLGFLGIFIGINLIIQFYAHTAGIIDGVILINVKNIMQFETYKGMFQYINPFLIGLLMGLVFRFGMIHNTNTPFINIIISALLYSMGYNGLQMFVMLLFGLILGLIYRNSQKVLYPIIIEATFLIGCIPNIFKNIPNISIYKGSDIVYVVCLIISIISYAYYRVKDHVQVRKAVAYDMDSNRSSTKNTDIIFEGKKGTKSLNKQDFISFEPDTTSNVEYNDWESTNDFMVDIEDMTFHESVEEETSTSNDNFISFDMSTLGGNDLYNEGVQESTKDDYIKFDFDTSIEENLVQDNASSRGITQDEGVTISENVFNTWDINFEEDTNDLVLDIDEDIK